MTWSVHSCRAEPIKRSTRPFCQGERTGAGHHPDHQAADEDQTAVRTPAVTSIRCWWSPGKQCRRSSVRPAVTQRGETRDFGLTSPCVCRKLDSTTMIVKAAEDRRDVMDDRSFRTRVNCQRAAPVRAAECVRRCCQSGAIARRQVPGARRECARSAHAKDAPPQQPSRRQVRAAPVFWGTVRPSMRAFMSAAEDRR